MEFINQGLRNVQHTKTDVNWFVQQQFRLAHVYHDKVIVDSNRKFAIWFRRKFLESVFLCYHFDFDTMSHVLDRFAEDCFVHELKKVLLKFINGTLAIFSIELDVISHPKW